MEEYDWLIRYLSDVQDFTFRRGLIESSASIKVAKRVLLSEILGQGAKTEDKLETAILKTGVESGFSDCLAEELERPSAALIYLSSRRAHANAVLAAE
jgi:hypothetical protein